MNQITPTHLSVCMLQWPNGAVIKELALPFIIIIRVNRKINQMKPWLYYTRYYILVSNGNICHCGNFSNGTSHISL